jgi:hypothetical protein
LFFLASVYCSVNEECKNNEANYQEKEKEKKKKDADTNSDEI